MTYNGLINDYLDAAGHGYDESGALFRPLRNNTTGTLDKAITPDGIYKLVRAYPAALGFEIGAHALRATAATNALDHQADIAKVQEWLGHANIATTRIYDHRHTRPEEQADVQGGILKHGGGGMHGIDDPSFCQQARNRLGQEPRIHRP